MQLTEDNIDEATSIIRQFLFCKQFSVTYINFADDYIDVVEEKRTISFTRSGHSIDSPQDIEDTQYHDKRVIAINSNIGVYFIPVDSKIVFYCNGFRVELPPARFRSTKEWVFTVAGQGCFELC